MTTTKPLYGASVALAVTTLLSLASDTNLLAGWSSIAIDNNSNLSMDEIVTVTLNTGTTPTAATTAEIYVWSVMDDTPTYPDTISGAEAHITLTSAGTKQGGAFKFAATIVVEAAAARKYQTSFGVAQFFGGIMPKKWGVFIVHNMVAALNAAGCVVTRTPVQYSIA